MIEPLTGATLLRTISVVTNGLINPRLSEVDWDAVAAMSGTNEPAECSRCGHTGHGATCGYDGLIPCGCAGPKLRERIAALENDSPDVVEARGWARHRESVLSLLATDDEFLGFRRRDDQDIEDIIDSDGRLLPRGLR